MKILIVDDEAPVRNLLVKAARKLGFETREAESGNLALPLLDDFVPDLVVTDILMPGISGLDLLAEIRRRGRGTVVVVVTALPDTPFILRALELQANNFIIKPFRIAEIAALFAKYAAGVERRAAGEAVRAMLLGRSLSLRMESRLDRIPDVAEFLVSETGTLFTDTERLSIRLGISELLINAVEHGNLGITYEEKSTTLQEGLEAFQSLLAYRLAAPEAAARQVRVRYDQSDGECAWTIADDGAGFDWRHALADDAADAFAEFHGRGIMITRYVFDTMTYEDPGNVVRVTKRPGRP